VCPPLIEREMESWAVDSEVQGQGGREGVWPLPKDVKEAVDSYLKLDAGRRATLHSGGVESFLFQPHSNYRTLTFDKGSRRAWCRRSS
jgi:hypothetical protein